MITLFSAPNYCGGFNKGAIISIDVISLLTIEKRYWHSLSVKKAWAFCSSEFYKRFWSFNPVYNGLLNRFVLFLTEPPSRTRLKTRYKQLGQFWYSFKERHEKPNMEKKETKDKKWRSFDRVKDLAKTRIFIENLLIYEEIHSTQHIFKVEIGR